MTNLIVLNRDQAVNKQFKKSDFVISVSDTFDMYPVLKSNKARTLFLKFDDTDDVFNNNKFTKFDAVLIKKFIDKNIKDIRHGNLYVHCFAGISRSSAIAGFLDIYLNGKEIPFTFQNSKYHPNKLVFKTMCEIFEIPYTTKLNDALESQHLTFTIGNCFQKEIIKNIEKSIADSFKIPVESLDFSRVNKL